MEGTILPSGRWPVTEPRRWEPVTGLRRWEYVTGKRGNRKHFPAERGVWEAFTGLRGQGTYHRAERRIGDLLHSTVLRGQSPVHGKEQSFSTNRVEKNRPVVGWEGTGGLDCSRVCLETTLKPCAPLESCEESGVGSTLAEVP